MPSTATAAPAAATDSPAALAGVILRARSGFYTVRTDAGREVECRLRGRVKKDRQSTDLAVIGDRVRISLLPDGSGMIEEVDERRSRLSRRQPGPRGAWKEDLLVANVDQALVVFACADPMPHLRMLDRFLVVAEHNEVPAVVVANKIDLVGLARASETFAVYERIGYEVHHVSAREGIGVEALADRLVGRVSVVTGPSGVGKSTLLNAIQPGLRIETGKVSAALHKGRHTTTSAELHRVAAPGGGYVADTPGLRELGLWRIPPDELSWCFPEFVPHIGGCGFSDCRHVDEPRCAIRSALERGEIADERYDSYRRMLAGDE